VIHRLSNRRARHHLYALRFGAQAEELLDRMVAGEKVIMRRKSDPQLTLFGDSSFKVKSFTFGARFKEALAKIGLVTNAKTGMWELGPGKEKERNALIEAQKKAQN
jgi:hypothetical protein